MKTMSSLSSYLIGSIRIIQRICSVLLGKKEESVTTQRCSLFCKQFSLEFTSNLISATSGSRTEIIC